MTKNFQLAIIGMIAILVLWKYDIVMERFDILRPVGAPLKTRMGMYDGTMIPHPEIKNYKTKDGTNEIGSSLYLFDNNYFSMDCCPGNYRNHQGCACITPRQGDLLATRLGNSTGVPMVVQEGQTL